MVIPMIIVFLIDKIEIKFILHLELFDFNKEKWLRFLPLLSHEMSLGLQGIPFHSTFRWQALFKALYCGITL